MSRAGYDWTMGRKVTTIGKSDVDDLPEKLRKLIRRMQEVAEHDNRSDSNMGYSEKTAETIFQYQEEAYRIGPWLFDCTGEYFGHLSAWLLEDGLEYIGATMIFYRGMAD